MVQLVRILDLRFCYDKLDDYDVLHTRAKLSTQEPKSNQHKDGEDRESISLFDQLRSSNGNPDRAHENELRSFLRATAAGDGTLDVVAWWKVNACSYPSVAKLARDLIAIPSSSVASEPAFSDIGNLITSRRTRLSEETIRACLLLRSWRRAIECD